MLKKVGFFKRRQLKKVNSRAFKIDEDLKSIQAEAFRTLRTNIRYSSVDKEKKIILVTSAEPGDGKSTSAMNLALTFAQEKGKRVLLVDCDLRRSILHKRFKVSNVVGLTDALISTDPCIEYIQIYSKSLDILTAGKTPPNPGEMLSSDKMEIVLGELRNQYDYIIIDSPPVLAVADALVLAPKADGVILIARCEKTKGKLLLEAKKKLESVRANIIGVSLTAVNDKDVEGYYYYY